MLMSYTFRLYCDYAVLNLFLLIKASTLCHCFDCCLLQNKQLYESMQISQFIERLACCLTFIISSSEGSSEGACSTSLPVWDLLQVDQGVGQRLPVHMEHLTPLSVLRCPAQHQSQLKQEHMEPLTDGTDTVQVR